MAIIFCAASRSSPSFSTTLVACTPFELPSATGFTIRGKRRSLGSRSFPVFMVKKFGVRIPCWRTIFFASALSRAMLSAAGSDPL